MRKENFMLKLCLFITIIKSSSESELKLLITDNDPHKERQRPQISLNHGGFSTNVSKYNPSTSKKAEIKEQVAETNKTIPKHLNNKFHTQLDKKNQILSDENLSITESERIANTKILPNYFEIKFHNKNNPKLCSSSYFQISESNYESINLKIRLLPKGEIEIFANLNNFIKEEIKLHYFLRALDKFCFNQSENIHNTIFGYLNDLITKYEKTCFVKDSENTTENDDTTPCTSNEDLTFEQKFAYLLFSFKKIYQHLKNNKVEVDKLYEKKIEETFNKYFDKKVLEKYKKKSYKMKVIRRSRRPRIININTINNIQISWEIVVKKIEFLVY